MICNNGSQIKSNDFLMVDIGKLSSPGALTSLKFLQLQRARLLVAGSKFERRNWRSIFIKRFNTGMILLARFGPTFAKYWQNLFAISSESVIVTPCSFIDKI